MFSKHDPESGRIDATLKAIGERAGCSLQNVNRIIGDLEADGVLRREGVGTSRSKLGQSYRITEKGAALGVELYNALAMDAKLFRNAADLLQRLQQCPEESVR